MFKLLVSKLKINHSLNFRFADLIVKFEVEVEAKARVHGSSDRVTNELFKWEK